MHAQRVGAGKLDALDARRRHQPRDILRVGAPSHALAQIVGDTVGHEFVGQRTALVLALEPDDVEAISRGDRRFAQLAGFEREQRLLEMLKDGPRTLTSLAEERLLYPKGYDELWVTDAERRTIGMHLAELVAAGRVREDDGAYALIAG